MVVELDQPLPVPGCRIRPPHRPHSVTPSRCGLKPSGTDSPPHSLLYLPLSPGSCVCQGGIELWVQQWPRKPCPATACSLGAGGGTRQGAAEMSLPHLAVGTSAGPQQRKPGLSGCQLGWASPWPVEASGKQELAVGSPAARILQ